MVKESISEVGLDVLSIISPRNRDIGKWQTWLMNYQFKENYPDDKFIWLTCALGLKALNEGNFGVGSVIVDRQGKLISQGHNEVFYPYFRGDRHAEMVTLERYEEANRGKSPRNHILYSSVEPCPMCFTRLIISGVGRVYYAAPDQTGGMVNRALGLPPLWLELSRSQVFAQVKCSPELVTIANDIYLSNADELNERLKKRSQGMVI